MDEADKRTKLAIEAAMRTIATLTRERDEARDRERLTSAELSIAGADRNVAEARAGSLKAQVAFTLSDASRLLRKEDVIGACPYPDECFYEGGPVRCGPCAVKASAALGVVVDDTHSHLPEVCRLRREVKAAESRATAAESKVDDLAMLVRMLVRHVPETAQVKAKAVDYLARHGLWSVPLRMDQDAAKEAPQP